MSSQLVARGTEGPSEVGQLEGISTWRVLLRELRRDRFAMAGVAVAGLLIVVALMAPVVSRVTGYGVNAIFPNQINSYGLPSGPTTSHLFGIDGSDHDELVRCLYGLGTSLVVSLVAMVATLMVGTVAGLLAGYIGGVVDFLVGRLADTFLAVPIVLVAISVSSVCSASSNGCLDGIVQPGIGLVTAIIALSSWPYVARIVRGQVLVLSHQEFVAAARGFGASRTQIMVRELLPNVAVPLVGLAVLLVPTNILFEATLSFLGVGVPPTTASLGGLLAGATNNSLFTSAWWTLVFPGVILLVATLAFNLVGEGVTRAIATQ